MNSQELDLFFTNLQYNLETHYTKKQVRDIKDSASTEYDDAISQKRKMLKELGKTTNKNKTDIDGTFTSIVRIYQKSMIDRAAQLVIQLVQDSPSLFKKKLWFSQYWKILAISAISLIVAACTIAVALTILSILPFIVGIVLSTTFGAGLIVSMVSLNIFLLNRPNRIYDDIAVNRSPTQETPSQCSSDHWDESENDFENQTQSSTTRLSNYPSTSEDYNLSHNNHSIPNQEASSHAHLQKNEFIPVTSLPQPFPVTSL